MALTFEQWMKLVDELVVNRIGIGVDDIPDCAYHDWFDQGIKPVAAAKRAIKRLKE